MPTLAEKAITPRPEAIKRSKKKLDGEFFAIRKILKALDPLSADECQRVVRYIRDFCGLPIMIHGTDSDWAKWEQRKP